MVEFEIRIHPTAEQDIDANVAWIADCHSWGKALEWLEALRQHIDTLSSLPDRCLAHRKMAGGVRRNPSASFSEVPLHASHPLSHRRAQGSCVASSPLCALMDA